MRVQIGCQKQGILQLFAAYPVSHRCITANPYLLDPLGYPVSCSSKRPIPSSRYTYCASFLMGERYTEMGVDKQFSFNELFSDDLSGVTLKDFPATGPRTPMSSFSSVLSANPHLKAVYRTLLTFWACSLLIDIRFRVKPRQ